MHSWRPSRSDRRGSKKDSAYGTFNYVTSKGSDGSMQIRKETIKELPAELQQVIKENE